MSEAEAAAADGSESESSPPAIGVTRCPARRATLTPVGNSDTRIRSATLHPTLTRDQLHDTATTRREKVDLWADSGQSKKSKVRKQISKTGKNFQSSFKRNQKQHMISDKWKWIVRVKYVSCANFRESGCCMRPPRPKIGFVFKPPAASSAARRDTARSSAPRVALRVAGAAKAAAEADVEARWAAAVAASASSSRTTGLASSATLAASPTKR